MATPKDTLWELDPHTLGKHLVLRTYLDAWLPVMGSWQGRILFIDGFAGPGEYKGGEEGSPQIAMRALVDHSADINAQVNFFFIEDKGDRAAHLEGVVDQWRPKLPSNSKVNVVQGTFNETMSGLLDYLEEEKSRLAPSFVMIDPFGFAGTPMSVVRRIMKNRRCEVYVSLMYEAINRWKTELPQHLDNLFGCTDWRDCAEIEDPDERRRCFYQLYEDQLRAAGARHVVHFDLYEGNRLIYSIFFATRHEKGSDLMKQAIWKIAPEGGYEFKGTSSAQLPLTLEPNFEPLMQQLADKFGDGNWHSIETIQSFMRSDKTPYHSGQLKTDTLKPMEKAGRLEADPDTRKRNLSYVARCKLRFKK